MNKFRILHKNKLKLVEKKSKDSAIFKFLDSQNYQDRLDKHLVDYHSSCDFEALVKKSCIGYFDKGYNLALDFVKKKYPNLDLDDLERGATLLLPFTLAL
ncbi:hypothetical protein ACH5RR_005939 [Cinchona calisaya]|uniref:Uncharacterized protein n=1 Tax=Cinchona calisaya TaxID=153742 RepID=A0ABD3AMK1_9GENT